MPEKWPRRALACALGVLLTSFLPLTQGVTPFPAAFFAAALASGTQPWIPLAASLLGGALSGRLGVFLSCAAQTALYFALRIRRARARRDKAPFDPDLAALCLAALGSLAGGAFATRDVAVFALSALLSAALAPLLRGAQSLDARRKFLAPEEKLSLAVYALLPLAGLARLGYVGTLAARAAAFLMAAMCVPAGAAAGALAGLLAGAATLSGPLFVCAAASGGAAGGALRSLPKPARYLAMAAGASLVCAIFPDAAVGLPDALLLLAALAAAWIMPARAYRFPERFAARREKADPRLREARSRVRRLREALETFRENCAPSEPAGGEGGTLANAMREKLCADCDRYIACWTGASNEAGRLLARLTSDAMDGRAPLDVSAIPPDQVRFCKRAPQLTRRLKPAVDAANARKAAERERAKAATLLDGPLRATCAQLLSLEKSLSRAPQADEAASERALGALDRAEIDADRLSAFRAPGMPNAAAPALALEVTRSGAGFSGEALMRVASVFSEALGGRFIARDTSAFVSAPPIRVRAYAFSREAARGAACGERQTSQGAACEKHKVLRGSVCRERATLRGAANRDQEASRGAVCGDRAALQDAACGDREVSRGAACGDRGVSRGAAYGDREASRGAVYGDREASRDAACGDRGVSRGAACGDRALCATLPDGRTALILSDGMGQGAEAAKESLAVTTLTHRLLAAGAEPIPAINAVNSMMRLRGGERYATLDLCLIDPYRREAAFFKLGASLSVHLRRGISARVEGGRLPPGVVEPAEPATARRRLRPGDAIVMVTDGVADMARAGEEEWLTTSLTVLPPNDPERLARLLVEAASRRRDGGKDDMTALCAVIEAEE